MTNNIVNKLTTACVCGPLDADGACLPCCARNEIERLRAAGDALVESLDHSRADIRSAVAAWEEARRG